MLSVTCQVFRLSVNVGYKQISDRLCDDLSSCVSATCRNG